MRALRRRGLAALLMAVATATTGAALAPGAIARTGTAPPAPTDLHVVSTTVAPWGNWARLAWTSPVVEQAQVVLYYYNLDGRVGDDILIGGYFVRPGDEPFEIAFRTLVSTQPSMTFSVYATSSFGTSDNASTTATASNDPGPSNVRVVHQDGDLATIAWTSTDWDPEYRIFDGDQLLRIVYSEDRKATIRRLPPARTRSPSTRGRPATAARR